MDLQQVRSDPDTLTGPPPTIAAVVQTRYGPPDVLALGRMCRPTPKPTEVLQPVRAALEELISGSTAGKIAIEVAHVGQRVAA